MNISERAKGSTKLDSLQVLRGGAATLVVLFHANVLFGEGNWIPSSRLGTVFAFGHSGVDLFFVLSGFIIVHAHWHDRPSLSAVRRYVLRRAIRIYPATIVTVLLLLAALPALRIVTSDQGFFGFDATRITASLLLAPLTCNYFPGVLWSLQDEVYFYIIFLSFYIHRKLFVFLVFGWAGLVVANAALAFSPSLGACGSSPLSFYNALFAGGVTSYFAWRHAAAMGWTWLSLPLVAAGAVVFGAAALADVHYLGASYWGDTLFKESNSTKLLTRGAFASGSMLLLIGAALSNWTPSTTVGRLLTLLGDASFAVYLMHLPVQGVLSRLLHSTTDVGLPAAVVMLGVMAISSLLTGVAFHIWLEKPMLISLRRATS